MRETFDDHGGYSLTPEDLDRIQQQVPDAKPGINVDAVVNGLAIMAITLGVLAAGITLGVWLTDAIQARLTGWFS